METKELIGEATVTLSEMMPKYPENKEALDKYRAGGNFPCVCAHCRSILPLEEDEILFCFKETEDVDFKEIINKKLVVLAKTECKACTVEPVPENCFDFELVKEEELAEKI